MEGLACTSCGGVFTPTACEGFFSVEECRECRRRQAPPTRGFSSERSLWVLNEPLARRWIPSENGGLLPEDVHGGSNAKFSFRCSSCQEVYLATPANKTRAGTTTCASCAMVRRGRANARPRGKTVADVPLLMTIWDAERNAVDPSTVAAQSNKKMWWKCEEGHNTFAVVANRLKGRGCRTCMEKLFISKGEKEVLAYIKSFYAGEVLNNVKGFNYPYETDIYLPDLSLGIDYNGVYWHGEEIIQEKKGMSSEAWHRLRLDHASSRGGSLYYLWEDDWTNRRSAVQNALRALIEEGSVDPMLTRLSR